jgi:hypothetical protein
MVELQIDRGASASRLADPGVEREIEMLTLDEIAQDLVRLLGALELSATVADYLLPGVELESGYFGIWLTVRGVMMEQVIDLSGISRVAGAVSRAEAVATGTWHQPDGPVGTTQGVVVASMLDELLEGAGYRGVSERFDWLR